jgi:small subunit ribosomal protein S6
VLLKIAAEGGLITEIERRLRVSEPVIKFITVRMDEEEKRLAKIKTHRETHVKRSTMPMQQPARVASIEAAAEPAAQPEADVPVAEAVSA